MTHSNPRSPSAWTPGHARDWFASHPRPFGFFYIPSYACNAGELWLPETFNADCLRRELTLAGETGYNCFSVPLHYQAWERQPYAFEDRFESLLEIAAAAGLKVIPVLFDDESAGYAPSAGWQPEPARLTRNSCWTACPGEELADNPDQYERLKDYATGTVRGWAKDPRILAWQVYRKPGAGGRGAGSLFLLERAFAWLREIHPSQPLYAPVWADPDRIDPIGLHFVMRVCMMHSDLAAFSCYGGPEETEAFANRMEETGLPLLLDGWFARPLNSSPARLLPLFERLNMGALQEGFFNGRTQLHIPPDWNREDGQPEVWYQDLVDIHGQWYSETEHRLLREYGTGLLDRK